MTSPLEQALNEIANLRDTIMQMTMNEAKMKATLAGYALEHSMKSAGPCQCNLCRRAKEVGVG